MLIVCPSCASQYTIDPDLVGAEGRTVRCAACRTPWFVGPAEAEEDWGAVEAVEAETRRSAPEPPPRTRAARGGARLGFAGRLSAPLRSAALPLAALLVLAALAGALAGRAGVVRTFPATARLYAAVGLPVNLRGLAFEGVTAELATTPSGTSLVVEGDVANASRAAVAVPPIAIALRHADGEALYSWTVDPPRQTLSEGERARFRARLAAPPSEARDVFVRFGPEIARPATPPDAEKEGR